MLSSRALISLAQYLGLQQRPEVELMFEKSGIDMSQLRYAKSGNYLIDDHVLGWLRASNGEQIHELLAEICRASERLRSKVNPKYLYEERMTDLQRCLLLDGYDLRGNRNMGYTIVTVDPTIGTTVPVDDDLSAELKRSNLLDREKIIQLMNNSADDFRKQPPDFNGSLTSARVSLETISKNIAVLYQPTIPMAGDPAKFGAVIAYLKNQAGFLDKNDEAAITGVYGFVSLGAHKPVGFTEEERVRLGRSMIASVCYFLIKKHNAMGKSAVAIASSVPDDTVPW